MLIKQSNEFLFERSLAMMLLLVGNVSNNFVSFGFAYAKRSVAFLPRNPRSREEHS
jgi:hypothetical protein